MFFICYQITFTVLMAINLKCKLEYEDEQIHKTSKFFVNTLNTIFEIWFILWLGDLSNQRARLLFMFATFPIFRYIFNVTLNRENEHYSSYMKCFFMSNLQYFVYIVALLKIEVNDPLCSILSYDIYRVDIYLNLLLAFATTRKKCALRDIIIKKD